MLIITTWNVNSIRARITIVLEWLKKATPDIVLLQELKVVEEDFPHQEFQDIGYNTVVVGQKMYNGVAILAKSPIEVKRRALPGDPSDEQARYVEAIVANVRVASIYLPNGNPVGTDKFMYKLAWMERLTAHARKLLELEERLVLGGDFNICPTDDDVFDPEGFAADALCRPESRARYRSLLHQGFTDAYRALNKQLGAYSYWDYRGGHWNRDEGLRIDHLLLSPQAADQLHAAGIDKNPRSKEKPSDHTPVWCELTNM